jgi:hypothetical protein
MDADDLILEDELYWVAEEIKFHVIWSLIHSVHRRPHFAPRETQTERDLSCNVQTSE